MRCRGFLLLRVWNRHPVGLCAVLEVFSRNPGSRCQVFRLQFADYHADVFYLDGVTLFDTAEQEQATADEVDTPGNPFTEPVYQRKNGPVDRRVALPPYPGQPMNHVGLRLILFQALNMARRYNALVNLLHTRRENQIPEFRLSQQKYLQQRLAVELDVGQQTQFLHGGGRQVLCFIHNEECAATFPVPAMQ